MNSRSEILESLKLGRLGITEGPVLTLGGELRYVAYAFDKAGVEYSIDGGKLSFAAKDVDDALTIMNDALHLHKAHKIVKYQGVYELRQFTYGMVEDKFKIDCHKGQAIVSSIGR